MSNDAAISSDAAPITRTGSKRIVELDSLRAIAALNLVLFHFTVVYTAKYGYTTPLGFEFPFGKYGVQLFFMLSGFVNAMTLLKKKNSADFLAARIMRICPAFWAVIVINLLIIGIAPLTLTTFTPEQVAANMTIMPNLLGYECMEPVTWTLQVRSLVLRHDLVMFHNWSVGEAVSYCHGVPGFVARHVYFHQFLASRYLQ